MSYVAKVSIADDGEIERTFEERVEALVWLFVTQACVFQSYDLEVSITLTYDPYGFPYVHARRTDGEWKPLYHKGMW